MLLSAETFGETRNSIPEAPHDENRYLKHVVVQEQDPMKLCDRASILGVGDYPVRSRGSRERYLFLLVATTCSTI